MVNRKPVRARGKLKLSRYFQIFKAGDKVAVSRERSLSMGFPKTIQGRTGEIVEKQGKAYVVKIADKKKQKKYIIEPVHLIRIKTIKTEKKAK